MWGNNKNVATDKWATVTSPRNQSASEQRAIKRANKQSQRESKKMVKANSGKPPLPTS